MSAGADLPLTKDAIDELERYIAKARTDLLSHIGNEIGESRSQQVTGRDVRLVLRRDESRAVRSSWFVVGFCLVIAIASTVLLIVTLGATPDNGSAVQLVAAAILTLASLVLLIISQYVALRRSTLLRHQPAFYARGYEQRSELIGTVSRIEKAARLHYEKQHRVRGHERVPLHAALESLVEDGLWSEKDLARFRSVLRLRNSVLHEGRIETSRGTLDELSNWASTLLAKIG